MCVQVEIVEREVVEHVARPSTKAHEPALDRAGRRNPVPRPEFGHMPHAHLDIFRVPHGQLRVRVREARASVYHVNSYLLRLIKWF